MPSASARSARSVRLLVPCHRVVHADGTPGEYMFGRTHKEALLRGEDANLDDVAELAHGGRCTTAATAALRSRLYPAIIPTTGFLHGAADPGGPPGHTGWKVPRGPRTVHRLFLD